MTKVFTDGLSFALPLLIMAVGAIYSEKSGVTNLAIEGFQGFGAFVGALAAILLMPYLPKNSQIPIYAAILFAALGGGVYACIHALLCINFKANQVISGVVINILAVALTTFFTSSANTALMGTACALVLGFVFYGAMAYQLLEKDGKATIQADEAQTLVLSGAQLVSEQTGSCEYAGESCTALVRSYLLGSGEKAEAITARPAAYIERLSEEGYVPQLITGFVLAEMDAVYAVRGDEAMLCARAGDTVFMLRAAADEQTVYSLGAGAELE